MSYEVTCLALEMFSRVLETVAGIAFAIPATVVSSVFIC